MPFSLPTSSTLSNKEVKSFMWASSGYLTSARCWTNTAPSWKADILPLRGAKIQLSSMVWTCSCTECSRQIPPSLLICLKKLRLHLCGANREPSEQEAALSNEQDSAEEEELDFHSVHSIQGLNDIYSFRPYRGEKQCSLGETHISVPICRENESLQIAETWLWLMVIHTFSYKSFPSSI